MTSPRDTAVYCTRKIDESGQVKARVVFEYEEVGSPITKWNQSTPGFGILICKKEGSYLS